jgi:DNA-binding NarL/FixJ family response regulator
MMEENNGTKKFLVIDSLPLRRAGLVSLLNSISNDGVDALASMDDIPSVSESSTICYFLVLFNLNSTTHATGETYRTVRRLKARFPDVPLVVLSDKDSRDDVIAAYHAGASGYLPATLEADVAVLALRLILTGGAFFPPTALDAEPQGTVNLPPEVDAPRGDVRFTPRQADVLRLLRMGKSNKMIARDLDMQESTVKVHVRQILRKLGAANRTQAALSCMTMAITASAEDPPERVTQARRERPSIGHAA